MISVNDIRNGNTIEVDGELFSVIEFLHVKPGKGAAFVRTKLRNVRTGTIAERTFRAGEKIGLARVDRTDYQFLYASGDDYTFMNTETYDQVTLPATALGDGTLYLKENMIVSIATWNGETIGVELPNTVELTVVETEPGFRGDTAQGALKPAKLETGYTVQVPLFINEGDVLKIDTRTGHYISRA